MGKDVINMIECGFCHKKFDVATEDIEWEHLEDVGEVEEGGSIHDYHVFQVVDCPYCGKPNKIVMHARGKNSEEFSSIIVSSMEIGSYLD